MKSLFKLAALLLLAPIAIAGEYNARPYGVAATIDFKLYNTDGTLDVDEADGGAEVTIFCDEDAGTTATNDFADEGSFYSIVLTASEMQCGNVTLEIAATDTEVIIIPTFGHASASFDYDIATIEGSDATDQINAAADAANADYDAVVPADLPSNFADLSITASTGLVDVTQTAADKVWGTTTRTVTAATNITSTGGTTVPQTGDSYARLGAPAGASVSADNAAIKAETAVIVADTNELQTDDYPTTLATLATSAALATVDGNVDDIETTIGAAGAGLTEAGGTGDQFTAVPYNTAWNADIESEALDALVSIDLDHLINTAESDTPADDSIVAKLAASDGDWSGYTVANNSLEALRDRGDAAWITGAGGTGMTPIFEGTAQSGTSTTIVLASATSIPDDNPNFDVQVCITAGTGIGQCRTVEDYVSSTDTATVSRAWTTTPSSDSVYQGWPAGAHVNAWAADVASVELGLEDSDDIWAASSRTLTELDEDNTTIDLNASNVGGIAGTINTLDALDTAQDTQHSTTRTVLNDLEMHMAIDAAFLNCEVNTANFAGSTTTMACILTDRDDGAVTQATGDLTGLEVVITSGAQIREKRYINSTTWDAGNSELQITLSRALPATLADAVTAIIR